MASACFIIGAGPFYGLPVAPGPEDVVLAADGGYRHCQTAGITPDLLLGDFDSLESERPDNIPTHTFPVEKDDTDTMLAIRYGLEQGYQTFHLYGGTGGRMDHTLANLQALGFLARHGARGYLYEEHMVFTAPSPCAAAASPCLRGPRASSPSSAWGRRQRACPSRADSIPWTTAPSPPFSPWG